MLENDTMETSTTAVTSIRMDVIVSVDSSFKMDVISTNFPRGISTSNRWRIDEDVSIG